MPKCSKGSPRAAAWLALGAFILIPLLLTQFGMRWRPLPLHLLVLLAAGGLALLWTRRKFASRRLWARPPAGWWHGPVVRAGALALAAGAYVLTCQPETAFRLLTDRPLFWLLIMILYPLLSVLPQEILFRVCLTDILSTACWGKLHSPLIPILGSALLFGWAHIIYAGYVALISTCLAGLALAWNYHRNREQPGAMWPLFLEHGLYGQIIFTTGLGHYFYVLRGATF